MPTQQQYSRRAAAVIAHAYALSLKNGGDELSSTVQDPFTGSSHRIHGRCQADPLQIDFKIDQTMVKDAGSGAHSVRAYVNNDDQVTVEFSSTGSVRQARSDQHGRFDIDDPSGSHLRVDGNYFKFSG